MPIVEAEGSAMGDSGSRDVGRSAAVAEGKRGIHMVQHVSSRGPGRHTCYRTGVRAALGTALLLLALAGCAATTMKHGHHFHDSDLQQIQPGMSQESVRNTLGTPDTTSALSGGNAFYYISSTRKEVAFFKPEEVDRRVVAIYFNQAGSVEQVANYGLKDGRVFDYVSRETPAHMRDKNFIARFFRGVGPKAKAFDD